MKRSPVIYYNSLKIFEIFENFNQLQLTELCFSIKEVRIPPNTTIIKEDELYCYVHILISGELIVNKKVSFGNENNCTLNTFTIGRHFDQFNHIKQKREALLALLSAIDFFGSLKTSVSQYSVKTDSSHAVLWKIPSSFIKKSSDLSHL